MTGEKDQGKVSGDPTTHTIQSFASHRENGVIENVNNVERDPRGIMFYNVFPVPPFQRVILHGT